MNWKTWFFLGVGLVVISLLIGWQMAPRVEEIKPSTGDLHGRQPIQVSFSRPMKPTSFETHLILSPSMAGVLTWNDDATLLTFTPNKTWPSGETAAVQITAGAQSRILLPTLREYKSEIPISPTLLIYLWPADGKSNLYLSNPETGENQALTSEESGVLDYSISAEGDQLYFSVAAENGINAIKTLNRLTGQTSRVEECDHGLCTSPRISPDGNFLAYEFISREPGILPGITVLPLNGKTRLVMGEPDQYLENPLWSPSGWLVYYDQTQKGYQFWNPDSDETRFLPNETGGDGSWSADGRYFICSEILFTSETLAPRHLLLYDLKEENLADLSNGNFLEDLNPSFSPRSLSLAFSRKSLDPALWSPGRQLWILNIEGGEFTQLTDAVDYHHTSFAWHPIENQLAFVRYNQAKLSDPPEIWVINSDGSNPLRLIINGFKPGWIP